VSAGIGSETRFEVVEPNAPAMIQSMRSVGYTARAAVADLVDNSISAQARNVWVTFHWDGAHSLVSVVDDGWGMDEATLTEAMRLGTRSPLEERPPSDLGRFGLGLKTASFSQCKRLTVWTRGSREAGLSVRCWDLDYVDETRQWRLLKVPSQRAAARAAPLEALDSGTVVVWENLDRLVEGSPVEDQRAQRRFLEVAEAVETHLAMVFHRFLEPPAQLTIWINGQRIASWDPFLRGEAATQHLAEETLTFADQRVVVRPYVLPHHSRLPSETHQRAAGPGGWNARQGFYIYRNRRLLVPGDWLNLGFQKEEHSKLARIQVDLPTALDGAWQIDVKKSTARPPGALRDELRRIAKVTRARATEIYRHRGKVMARAAARNDSFVWSRMVRRGKVFYRVNRDYPLVRQTLASITQYRAELEALLRMIEETVPAPLISLDDLQNPDEQAGPFEGAAAAEVADLLRRTYVSLRSTGLSPAHARERLAGTEPFNRFPELIATLEEESG
jgi:hypothetical protein